MKFRSRQYSLDGRRYMDNGNFLICSPLFHSLTQTLWIITGSCFYGNRNHERKLHEESPRTGSQRRGKDITEPYGRLRHSEGRTHHKRRVPRKVWRISCGKKRSDAVRRGSGRRRSLCDTGALLPPGQNPAVHGYHPGKENRKGLRRKPGQQSAGGGKRRRDPPARRHSRRNGNSGRRVQKTE